MTREQLLAAVMALDPATRRELVEDLCQLADDGRLTSTQIAELRRRVEAARRGQTTFIAGDRVTSELVDRLDTRALDAAWLEEVRRREASFARGEMSTSPVDEVISRILSKKR